MGGEEQDAFICCYSFGLTWRETQSKHVPCQKFSPHPPAPYSPQIRV